MTIHVNIENKPKCGVCRCLDVCSELKPKCSDHAIGSNHTGNQTLVFKISAEIIYEIEVDIACRNQRANEINEEIQGGITKKLNC